MRGTTLSSMCIADHFEFDMNGREDGCLGCAVSRSVPQALIFNQKRLGPSYFFIPLVLGPLNSLVWYVPSLRYTRGLGWRMHCGAEITESSTNKQHHLSNMFSTCNFPFKVCNCIQHCSSRVAFPPACVVVQYSLEIEITLPSHPPKLLLGNAGFGQDGCGYRFQKSKWNILSVIYKCQGKRLFITKRKGNIHWNV